MIIAIDGTAASGKGTLAKHLAQHLGYDYLDTGALYRAVALSLLNDGMCENNVSENASQTYNFGYRNIVIPRDPNKFRLDTNSSVDINVSAPQFRLPKIIFFPQSCGHISTSPK